MYLKFHNKTSTKLIFIILRLTYAYFIYPYIKNKSIKSLNENFVSENIGLFD